MEGAGHVPALPQGRRVVRSRAVGAAGVLAAALSCRSGRAPREVTHDGVRIALVRLETARSASGPVPPGDYRATLSLAR
jgi:hypothetical protein